MNPKKGSTLSFIKDKAYTQKERGYRFCELCNQPFRHRCRHKCKLKKIVRY